MSLKDANIVIDADGDRIRSLYAVFCPGATVARTIQMGRDHECHAFVDVDADNFPTAIELRGWKQFRVPAHATLPPPVSKDKLIKSLMGLAFDLLKEHRESKTSLSKVPEIVEEASSLIGAAA